MNTSHRPNPGFHVASYRMDNGLVEVGYLCSVIHATVEDVNEILDPTEKHLLKTEGHIVVVHMNGKKNVIVK